MADRIPDGDGSPPGLIAARGDAGTLDREVIIAGGRRRTVRWLIEELARAEDRATAARADAGRRERRAADAAMDCGQHGREIHYLRHVADWSWHGEQRAEDARNGIVRALIVAADRAGQRTEPVPAAVVARELRKAIDGQDKALRRPRSPFAGCAHDTACGHGELSGSLKGEISRVLRLEAGHG